VILESLVTGEITDADEQEAMMGVAEVRIFDDSEEFAQAASDFVIWAGEQATNQGGLFRLALAGGSTPKPLYALLAKPARARKLDWRRVVIFFSDERCVPSDHPESNFRMVQDTLLAPLGLPAEQVHRIAGEQAPEQAAREYEEAIRKAFGLAPPAWPRFDLILLGLGQDGHTASLFPGAPALAEHRRLVVPALAPQGVRQRVTFTVPLINHARTVVFLVSGAHKAPAVQIVLENREADPTQFPAKLIQPEQGRLIWFLDRAAAALLTVENTQLVSHEL
jgi:6-phosphogluconolactonase